MEIITDKLLDLAIGKPEKHLNLALFPLIDADAATADYLTLDQALDAGALRISELGDNGSVPELGLRNDADRSVLLLDGEELVGAKQNRVLNITILVAPGKTMVIPVSCVEAGRWAFHEGREFSSANRTMYARGRAEKMSQVSDSIRRKQSRRSNQSKVWDNIAMAAADFDVQSPTEAMSDIYDSQQENLASFETAFDAQSGQTGAVFVIDGNIAGCEVFDAAETWARLAPKLIASYGLDALQAANAKTKTPTAAAVQAFLRKVSNANATSHKALGMGRDIRIDGQQLVGGALAVDDRLVHLSAFAVNDDGSKGGPRSRSRLMSVGQRRHNRRH